MEIYILYPEEMNRKLTTNLANIYFAPTKGNYNNLIKEGIDPKKISITGNTVIDALLSVIKDDYKFENNILNEIDYKNRKIIVMTCHRRDNWGKPMENIFTAVKEIAEENNNVEIIYPVHLNEYMQISRRYYEGTK